MKRIFISAGDPSGDIHAARMMKALKSLIHDVEFVGIGGECMTKEGLDSIAPMSRMSVVGFWEVARQIGFFRQVMRQSKELLLNGNIDLFIPVDYPGFNIKLASFAKKNNIPVIYYIAPQLWAWGENRAEKLANAVDKLLVVFPFEVDFFKKYGIEADFVGHPLLDDPYIPENIATRAERESLFAFFPGSRKQELVRHLPIIMRVGEIIRKRFPDVKFAIACTAGIDKSIYSQYIDDKEYWYLEDDSKSLMQRAAAGVVKTGTSNLEAALCGMPFTMFYKTSLVSYLLGKKLVSLPNVSIVNILSGSNVVNEYIQSRAAPELIAADVNDLYENIDRYEDIQGKFEKIREMLGNKGASHKAAELIAEFLSNNAKNYQSDLL